MATGDGVQREMDATLATAHCPIFLLNAAEFRAVITAAETGEVSHTACKLEGATSP